MRAWTIKEIEFLTKNRNKMTASEIAKKLGRTKSSVNNKTIELNLKKEVLYKVVKGYEILAIGTAKECAEILNVSERAIYSYATPYTRKRAIKNGHRYAIRL